MKTAYINLLGAVIIFMKSSALYHQFLELCVTSYPSPLEESAPRGAKFFLLVLAGTFEYLAALWAANLLGCSVIRRTRHRGYPNFMRQLRAACQVVRAVRKQEWQRRHGPKCLHGIRVA
jgi:hypothetical protein